MCWRVCGGGGRKEREEKGGEEEGIRGVEKEEGGRKGKRRDLNFVASQIKSLQVAKGREVRETSKPEGGRRERSDERRENGGG